MRRNACFTLTALLLASLASAAPPGRVYYVATDGSPNNPGTKAAPWSLEKANQVVVAGDVVYLRAGRYQTPIAPLNSGTAAARIVFAKAPDDPKDRPALVTGRTSGGDFLAINLHNRSYVIVDGIQVDGGGPLKNQCTVQQWVNLSGEAQHDIIQHCVFRYAWQHGFLLRGRAGQTNGHHTVRQNVLFHCGQAREDTGEAMRIQNSHHNLIEGNDLEYGGHNLIQLWEGASFNVLRGNRLRNPWERVGTIIGRDCVRNVLDGNRIFDSAVQPIVPPEEETAWKAWKMASPRNIYRRNCFYDNSHQALEAPAKAAAPVQSCTDHNKVYHNVFYRNHGSGWRIFSIARGGTVRTAANEFVNNVFLDNGGADTAQIEFALEARGLDDTRVRNNALLKSRPGQGVVRVDGRLLTLAELERSHGNNFSGNRELDPQFVDAEKKDFRLRPTSPLIDAGAFLTATIGDGDGNVIPVRDAEFFVGCDNYGIEGVPGDLIQLQGGARVTVLFVDWNKQTLKVSSPVRWRNGQGLSLAYEGQAPDIGAVEYVRGK